MDGYEELSEAGKVIVDRIVNSLPPIGLTLTREEADVIMKRIGSNVYGASHAGWKR
jgi:hypothetical protein